MDIGKNKDGRKIPFVMEDGNQVQFCVIEQTRFYGVNYLLVTEDEDSEETDAFILKDLSSDDCAESVYEIVEDDEELCAVAGLFDELLEDVDIVAK